MLATRCALPAALWIAALSCCASALETDQFHLPPKPLADVGPEVDQHIRQTLTKIIEPINDEIQTLQEKLRQTDDDAKRRKLEQQIAGLQDDGLIPVRLFTSISHGMPESDLEKWLRTHPFDAQPARYEIRCADSIYGDAMLYKPLLVAAMAPTMRIHGVLQGTDKLGHFFQQGYKYREIYDKAIDKGKSEDQARAAAVKYGVDMEKTWGGQWWTGAYSHGDLAANYAGFKFYLNLTRPITIGKTKRPAILVLRDGLWQFNEKVGDDWLAVFITEHFDEAFNPGWLDGPMRRGVSRRIAGCAARWVEHYETSEAAETERMMRLQTWHGEPYGHQGYDGVVSLHSAYFKDKQHAARQ